MGLRKDRLADEIRDIVGSCFLGGKMADPRLEGVTITAVKLSGDLQIASVYYRVYSDDLIEKAQKGLESAAGFFRKKLADALDIRRVPELKFYYDESIEYGSNIEKLLMKIRDDK
jgi:ribosome-binding factor A